MILLWFTIVGAFLTVDTKPLMKKLSFEGCKQDSWRVTDISLEPDGNKVHVVADVGYDQEITNKLHQIKLTLLGCDKNYKCRNHTNVIVNDVDCLGKNLTELDKEACDIAKTLAEWELDTGENYQKSKNNQTSVAMDQEKICVHYDTKLIDANAAVRLNNNQSIQIINNQLVI